MTRVIGYGEDFLTFWAVTERLDLILKQLKDNTNPGDCQVFFRPSFGRKEYGEFDAIIVTLKTAYLVESKWDKSDIPNNVLKLDKKQVRRHEILKWYHRNWSGEDWDKFAKEYNARFRERFPGKYIPLSKDLLGHNPQTVLTSIRGRELKNVLLFFHRGELPEIVTTFEVVKIEYKPTRGNYIELGARRC